MSRRGKKGGRIKGALSKILIRVRGLYENIRIAINNHTIPRWRHRSGELSPPPPTSATSLAKHPVRASINSTPQTLPPDSRTAPLKASLSSLPQQQGGQHVA